MIERRTPPPAGHHMGKLGILCLLVCLAFPPMLIIAVPLILVSLILKEMSRNREINREAMLELKELRRREDEKGIAK